MSRLLAAVVLVFLCVGCTGLDGGRVANRLVSDQGAELVASPALAGPITLDVGVTHAGRLALGLGAFGYVRNGVAFAGSIAARTGADEASDMRLAGSAGVCMNTGESGILGVGLWVEDAPGGIERAAFIELGWRY